MKALLIIAVISLFFLGSTSLKPASACELKSCITVRADDERDEIVITLNGGSNKKIVKREPRKASKPENSGSFLAISDPDQTWIPYHPDLYKAWREAARKSALTRKSQAGKVNRPERSEKVVALSLSDQVSHLIPIGDIHFQPAIGATVNKDVYFWTMTPKKFSTVLRVGAIPVRIDLESEFTWSYGEGEKGKSSARGAPYPVPLNVHTYRESGVKRINLETLWRGTFTVAGVASPIDGVITQNRSRNIEVFPAPHRVIR